MKFGSLFSGIGGFDLALERAGMECVWQCEIDDKARAVLEHHWPNVEKIKDVRNVGRNTGAVDVICGGFPCQDVSLAGKRAGLAGKRSGLWFEFARIIDELEPGWVVIENVPGLLSSNKGRDFGEIVSWLAKRGYGVCWRILDAQYFGVPQRRRRVFIVGSRGSGASAEVLFEREGVSWNPPARKSKRKDVAQTITSRIGKGGFTDPVNGNIITSSITTTPYSDRAGEENKLVCWEMQHASEVYREAGNICPTLQSRMGTGGNSVPLIGVRRLTPTECERLQGFPDGWTDNQSDSARYKQLGNAVAVPVVEWIGKRIVKQ